MEGAVDENTDTAAMNALKANIKEKGQNAYYYAHNRDFHVPADAIIRTGEGIITGGSPTKIESPPPQDSEEQNNGIENKQYMRPITNYVFADEDEKVTVIVDFAKEEDNPTPTAAEVSFMNSQLDCRVTIAESKVLRRLFFSSLSGDIIPEECKYRLNAEKRKVTITMKKKHGGSWSTN